MAQHNVLFSIIIPHHNMPDLLARCLDSIPKREDVQIIIVDDNSNPDIVNFDLFPGNECKNVVCIFDKQGGGAGYARNLGIERATGKWLVFADSDDFFTDDFFEIMCQFVNSDAKVIHFTTQSVYSESLQSTSRHEKVNKAIKDALKGKISKKDAILAVPGPCAKMFARDFIMEHNIRFDEIICTEDVMFVVKATLWADKVDVIDKDVYVIVEREGSLSNLAKREPEKYLCSMEVYIRRNKFYSKYDIPKKPIILYVWKARKLGCKTFFMALWLTFKTRSLFSGFTSFLKIVENHLMIWK